MMKLKSPSNSSIKLTTAAALYAVALWLGGVAEAALKVEVTEGVAGGVPVAVLPFGSHASDGREFDDIIAGDLAYSGLFSIVAAPEATTLAPGSAVDYDSWLALGVEKLIFGTVSRQDNLWLVRVELHDVASNARVLGYEINSPSFDYAAHHVSDNIYKELTGIDGVFRTRLAFVTVERHGWRSHRFSLYVSDADGYNAIPIFVSESQLMSPVWSPDMKRIAYVSYEAGQPEVVVQTLASAKRVNLGDHIGAAVSPAWSPDGAYLSYVSSRHGNPNIYTVRLSDMQIRRVTDDAAIDTEPVYTSDGTIIFTSDRSGSPQLYRSQRGDPVPKRLTFNGARNSDADVSPDGSQISFLSWNQEGFAIVLQDLASGNETELARGKDLERPRYTANGQLLGYLRQDRLMMVTADGMFGNPVKVQVPGNIRGVAWSPLVQ